MPRLLLPALFLLGASRLGALELHVSPQGNDAATGASDAPFATLTRVRDEVRRLKQGGEFKEAVNVWIHDGLYEIAKPLDLEAQDSGTAESPVTWRAAKGAKPLLLGSVKVTEWQPHEGKIVKADVSKLLPKGFIPKQLLCDGERQWLARHPNYDAQDPLYGGWAFVQPLPEGKAEGHQWKRECYVAAKDVRTWAHPEDAEIDIFAFYGWWNWIVPVKGFDKEAGKLILAKDCGYDLHPHNRYHVQGVMEELDAPGEWFHDRRTGWLYFWPAKDIASSQVRLPTLDSFVRIKQGTRNVAVRGLSFQGCVATAITLENTEQCRVEACTVTHCGGFNGAGISVHGGHDNHVVGCDVSYTGSTGVGIGGGDRITLTGANNVVENCHIHHVGVIQKIGAGVGLNGVGNRVAHNLIHDCPRMAVQFSGNNLVIEYNHMHHTVLETQDGGAIYTGGRDWISSRGSIIRHNLIHDTIGVGQESDGLRHPFFTWGIYMDDNTGGVDIIGNIVARAGRAMLHLHNGRDCIVENNVFVDGAQKQLEYDGWAPQHHYIKDHMDTMVKGWESVKDQPAWKDMRGMKLDPRNAFFPDKTMMSGNVIQRNIVMWHDASIRYADLHDCLPAHNVSDKNLIWNGGKPVRTALSKIGPDTGADLLAGTSDFAKLESGKTPKGWGWNHKPRPDLKLAVQDGALLVEAATSADPKNNHTCIHGPNIALKPGAAYRARLKIKGTDPDMSVGFAFGIFVNGKGYWQTGAKPAVLTQEWQDIEVTGNFPGPQDSAWKDWMKDFWLRMDVNSEKGAVILKEVSIREAEPMNEWAAWQSEGWDKDSIIADPLFENEAKDDYRLKKDSPAWKLGFERIPVEKIGLYQDERRATWPVEK